MVPPAACSLLLIGFSLSSVSFCVFQKFRGRGNGWGPCSRLILAQLFWVSWQLRALCWDMVTGVGASRVMCHCGGPFAESRDLVSKIQNFFGPNNLFSRLTALSVTRHKSDCTVKIWEMRFFSFYRQTGVECYYPFYRGRNYDQAMNRLLSSFLFTGNNNLCFFWFSQGKPHRLINSVSHLWNHNIGLKDLRSLLKILWILPVKLFLSAY